MSLRQYIFIVFILFQGLVLAQKAPFEIQIEKIEISGLGGLQSYAWGQHSGKWLIVGGRLDGLHRRQPFASFDAAGNNNQLVVVDPISKTKWTAGLASLPVGLQEQLSSTNMVFHQEGEYLYLAGGYGYSPTAADHITYPYLSAIKIPEVINAIINGTAFSSYFRQITDTMMAVTGGYLNKINNTYYLTGGQKFTGRYNPMGPTHGPGFVQVYTNSIRKFKIVDNGTTLSINHLPGIVDATNLHRRDYNVVPQIMPGGNEGLTAFSGVFQTAVDLPYLNCVNIDSVGYVVNNSFSQYYNQYHCAHIPLYSASNNEMHTLFFGGIAQYYDSSGILVQDNNVPFVKTIARVTRSANGSMAEYKLPVEMPGLLGAGSEFISQPSLPQYSNEVIKLDELVTDTTLLGFIYGGISSAAANIFFINTGAESIASNHIYKVYLVRNTPTGLHTLNHQSIGSLKVQVYPNPGNGEFVIKFNIIKVSDVKITLQRADGKKIDERILTNINIGENIYEPRIRDLHQGGIFFLTVETPDERVTQKIVIDF